MKQHPNQQPRRPGASLGRPERAPFTARREGVVSSQPIPGPAPKPAPRLAYLSSWLRFPRGFEFVDTCRLHLAYCDDAVLGTTLWPIP
jgi:hypothetical protein